jgi:hypothetical protein
MIENEFTQGNNTKMLTLAQGFSDIKKPSEYIKSNKSHQPLATAAKTPRNATMQNTRDQKQPTTTQSSYIPENSFYKTILCILDPTKSLLFGDSLEKAMAIFKNDLACNLSNANELFKKLGFSRKRSICIDDMKARLTAAKGDDQLYDPIFEYISKLSKYNIIVTDFKGPIYSRVNFATEKENKYIIVNRDNVRDTLIMDDNDHVMRYLVQKLDASIFPLSKHNSTVLKDISKYIGTYKSGAVKDVILKALEEECDKYKL